MIGNVVFCEKRKMMKVVDSKCWNCKYNVINGGFCYPWIKTRAKAEI